MSPDKIYRVNGARLNQLDWSLTDPEILSRCDKNGFVRDASGRIEENNSHLDNVGSEINSGRRVSSVEYISSNGELISISFDKYQQMGRPQLISTDDDL